MLSSVPEVSLSCTVIVINFQKFLNMFYESLVVSVYLVNFLGAFAFSKNFSDMGTLASHLGLGGSKLHPARHKALDHTPGCILASFLEDPSSALPNVPAQSMRGLYSQPHRSKRYQAQPSPEPMTCLTGNNQPS